MPNFNSFEGKSTGSDAAIPRPRRVAPDARIGKTSALLAGALAGAVSLVAPEAQADVDANQPKANNYNVAFAENIQGTGVDAKIFSSDVNNPNSHTKDLFEQHRKNGGAWSAPALLMNCNGADPIPPNDPVGYNDTSAAYYDATNTLYTSTDRNSAVGGNLNEILQFNLSVGPNSAVCTTNGAEIPALKNLAQYVDVHAVDNKGKLFLSLDFNANEIRDIQVWDSKNPANPPVEVANVNLPNIDTRNPAFIDQAKTILAFSSNRADVKSKGGHDMFIGNWDSATNTLSSIAHWDVPGNTDGEDYPGAMLFKQQPPQFWMVQLAKAPGSKFTIYEDPGLTNQPVTPAVTLQETGGSTDVTEGGATDTIILSVQGNPTQKVAINMTPGQGLNLSTDVVFFNAGDPPQTITISAPNDGIAQGPHSSTIKFVVTSQDKNFDGLSVNPNPLPVNIADAPSGSGTGGMAGAGGGMGGNAGMGGVGGMSSGPGGMAGAGGETTSSMPTTSSDTSNYCNVQVLDKTTIDRTGQEVHTNASTCTASCDDVGRGTFNIQAGPNGATCIIRSTDKYGYLDMVFEPDDYTSYTAVMAGGQIGLPDSDGFNMLDYNNHGSHMSFEDHGWEAGLVGTKGRWVTVERFVKENPLALSGDITTDAYKGAKVITNYHGAIILKQDGEKLPNVVLQDSKVQPTAQGKEGYAVLNTNGIIETNLPRDWEKNGFATGDGGINCVGNSISAATPDGVGGGVLAALIAAGVLVIRKRKQEDEVTSERRKVK